MNELENKAERCTNGIHREAYASLAICTNIYINDRKTICLRYCIQTYEINKKIV